MKSNFYKSSVVLIPMVFAGAASAQSISVTVSPGDTLAQIAQDKLGDSNRWREICELNKDVVGSDCNLIVPGMVITMPGGETSVASSDKPEMAADADKEPAAEAENAPAEPAETEEAAAAAPADSGTFELDVANVKGAAFRAGADGPYKIERAEGSDVVTLSGGEEKASPSGRPGIWLDVGEDFEKSASGKKIKITLDVVSKADGVMSAAYSTADTGNSGWHELNLTPGDNTVSFEYDVPELKAGRSDFLGIQPDPKMTGQSIDVKSVKIEVVS